MALLQISEPGRVARPAPAPHRGRHRPRHDQLARRRGAQRRRRVPARRRRPRRSCRRSCATSPTARREVGYDGAGRAGRRSDATPSSRSSGFMGRGLADIVDARARCRTTSSTRPGMVQLRTRGGRQDAGRGLGRDPGDAARARRGHASTASSYGAVITVPAYFDDAQRQATKDAGAARRPQRAAPDQRADGGGDRLRPGQRQPRASTRSTTSAAARSTSRSCG